MLLIICMQQQLQGWLHTPKYSRTGTFLLNKVKYYPQVDGVMMIILGNAQGNWSSNPQLFVIHFVLMLSEKTWIHLLSSQLWLNSRADWAL